MLSWILKTLTECSLPTKERRYLRNIFLYDFELGKGYCWKKNLENVTRMVWFCGTVINKWKDAIKNWEWLTIARMEADCNVEQYESVRLAFPIVQFREPLASRQFRNRSAQFWREKNRDGAPAKQLANYQLYRAADQLMTALVYTKRCNLSLAFYMLSL